MSGNSLKPPINHAVAKEALEANSRLHDIFTPLCDAVAKHGYSALDTPEHREKINNLEMIELPAGDEFGIGIAWDVFEGHDLPPQGQNFDDFEMGEILARYVEKYPPRDQRKVEDQKFTENPFQDITMTRIHIRDLAHYLLDTDAKRKNWKNYEERIRSLSPAKQTLVQEAHVLRTQGSKFRPWPWEEDLPVPESDQKFRHADRFIYAHNTAFVRADHLDRFSKFAIPIGEYGPEFTTNLIKTGVLLQNLAGEALGPVSGDITEENRDTLETYTARAAMRGKADPDTTLATVNEGILSIVQTLSLLTMEKVEGFEDPNDLVAAIVDSGLVEKIARFSAMGFVGPITFAGRFFPNAIENNGTSLDLSQSFKDYLHAEKERYVGFVATRLIKRAETGERQGGDPSVLLGKVCPVADKNGGIHQLSETFSHILKLLA